MLVIEKKRDIGFLKSMGAENRLIRQIFLGEGLLVASVGAGMGAFLAILVLLIQRKFEVLKIQGSGTFVIDAYPVKILFSDFLLVILTVLVITMLASWFPAKHAARQLSTYKEE